MDPVCFSVPGHCLLINMFILSHLGTELLSSFYMWKFLDSVVI